MVGKSDWMPCQIAVSFYCTGGLHERYTKALASGINMRGVSVMRGFGGATGKGLEGFRHIIHYVLVVLQ